MAKKAKARAKAAEAKKPVAKTAAAKQAPVLPAGSVPLPGPIFNEPTFNEGSFQPDPAGFATTHPSDDALYQKLGDAVKKDVVSFDQARRRAPRSDGNCFSAFKQHFARGQNFSYDLTDLGRYYVDYVRLMDHIDQVLSGRVHRIHYERLVADPENEVRARLAYCGLLFENSCLRFHIYRVRTPSAEQVRQPVFTDAVEHRRNYEFWLGSLKTALESALVELFQGLDRRDTAFTE